MSNTSSKTHTRGGQAARPSGGVAKPQAPGSNGALAWVLGIFAVLVLLAMAGIWLFIPFWYARLAGDEARGTVYYVRDCGADDSGDGTYQDTLVFRDAEGQMQETTSGSDCVSDFANGQTLMLWYLPGLPGDALLGGPVINFYLWSVLYLVVVVACLILFFLMTRGLLRACLRAEAFGRLWLGGIACLVMLVPILVLTHLAPPPGGQSGDGPTRNFHAGETVSVEGRWVIRVQGAQVVQTGEPREPSPDGTVCLELDLMLRNTTRQALSVDVGQFALFDGQAKALVTSCSIDGSLLTHAQVLPGAALEGALAYRVPAPLSECYLAFRPGTPEENVGRYFWRLQVSAAS